MPSDLAYILPSELLMCEIGYASPAFVRSCPKLGNFRPNLSIVIFGYGLVGLPCIAIAKAFEVSRIIGIDIISHRLEFAKSYGYYLCYNIWFPTSPVIILRALSGSTGKGRPEAFSFAQIFVPGCSPCLRDNSRWRR